MRTRRLGSTQLCVSEMGFGAFGIGGNASGNSYGPTDDEVSVDAIRASLDQGCTFFDTADVYGYGHSEELLRRAIGGADKSNSVTIATKVGGNFSSGRTVMDFSRNHILASVDGSLKRLGRDHVDLYQLHNPDLRTIQRGDAFETLDNLVKSGKVRYYGVSVHTCEEAMACLAVPSVSALQIPYSLLSLLNPQLSLANIFEVAQKRGVGLIARQPLAGGFLSGKHTTATVYGPGDIRGLWPRARQRTFVALANSLRDLVHPSFTMAQVALRFVLDEPSISTTIVGIKTPAQALENFATVNMPALSTLIPSTDDIEVCE